MLAVEGDPHLRASRVLATARIRHRAEFDRDVRTQRVIAEVGLRPPLFTKSRVRRDAELNQEATDRAEQRTAVQVPSNSLTAPSPPPRQPLRKGDILVVDRNV